ncbi:MAG: lytic transglycosylase domain-containing protein, partial [Phaeodactylibacter sp.]|nr:lytic transglycosylase domain-containing protein [Phaeodactylibacter sp.]
MKSKVLFALSLLALLFLCFSIFSGYAEKESRLVKGFVGGGEEGLPQVVQSIELNRYYDFAGEALPMKDFDVRERLERELLTNAYWHSSTLQHLKNS